MAYNEFIAAIQLGTSRLAGIVGKREANGAFTVIAYDTEDSAGCIRRGCIRNVNETAAKMKSLLAKLQQRMPGNRIGKVFVGVGGQSIRTIEIPVHRTLGTHTAVTDALMDELKDESKSLQPEGLDALDVLEPACYLDGRLEPNPVGTFCSAIEAKYQQAVARQSYRSSVQEAVKLAGVKDGVAGIIVTPLALADAVLSDGEKEMGCALIDFGGGVTSVSAYKKGRLLGMYVIPLGGNLITKDLSSHFGIVEADAEKIKREYGQAVTDEGNQNTIGVNITDKKELLTIKLEEFYRVIAARQQEIIENVHACLKAIAGEKEAENLKSFLRAGVFITGNAASLPQIAKATGDCMEMNVSLVPSIRKNIEIKGAHSDMLPDFSSIGLLLQAERNYINCAVQMAPPPPPPPSVVKQPDTITVQETQEQPVVADPPQPATSKPGRRRGFIDKIKDGMEDLFKEENTH